jgi:lipopolysaccharide/colanic/teichoic acid biosynthesis glycosyltransferase
MSAGERNMASLLISAPAASYDGEAGLQRAARRFSDVLGAAGAIVVLSPLFGLAALMVRISDGRPILFRQPRVGRNGRPFFILKFRTMQSHSAGTKLTVSGDRRVTRAGAWLRKRKLDELPQLFNVLRGDMSFIGPRPEVPEYVEPDDELWRAVLSVRPGITDLATLLYRNEEELLANASDPEAYYRHTILPEKLRLNLLYQRSRSLFRDLQLIAMTGLYSFFPKVFNRERVVRIFDSTTKVNPISYV